MYNLITTVICTGMICITLGVCFMFATEKGIHITFHYVYPEQTPENINNIQAQLDKEYDENKHISQDEILQALNEYIKGEELDAD